jgi:hypothetical protein
MRLNDHLTVVWIDDGCEPLSAPDPNFPAGRDIGLSGDAVATCRTDLPWPAKRCGVYVVECRRCGTKVAVSTAGRPDDPRSLIIPCREHDKDLGGSGRTP